MSETQTLTLEHLIVFREIEKQDEGFVLSSWKRSHRADFEFMSNSEYYAYANTFDAILNKCSCIIVSEKKDPSMIYGYIVFKKIPGVAIIHYIYVKQAFREFGIATRLFAFATANSEHVVATCERYSNQNVNNKIKKYGVIFKKELKGI